MSQVTGRIVFTTMLALGVAGLAGAQSNQANPNAKQGKEKRHPNQVPDTGSGSAQDAEPATGAFERVIENVVVAVGADGTLSATLDDSFMEAVTVSQRADGSLDFSHYTGLATATRAVEQAAKTPPTLPSRTLPAMFPTLEEKD
jgi:hypothetical protein